METVRRATSGKTLLDRARRPAHLERRSPGMGDGTRSCAWLAASWMTMRRAGPSTLRPWRSWRGQSSFTRPSCWAALAGPCCARDSHSRLLPGQDALAGLTKSNRSSQKIGSHCLAGRAAGPRRPRCTVWQAGLLNPAHRIALSGRPSCWTQKTALHCLASRTAGPRRPRCTVWQAGLLNPPHRIALSGSPSCWTQKTALHCLASRTAGHTRPGCTVWHAELLNTQDRVALSGIPDCWTHKTGLHCLACRASGPSTPGCTQWQTRV